MRYSEDKIAEVRAAADIVEVVSDYVQLKKNGTRFIGLCPFHKEKTPSFSVSPNMSIYKCFGCGKGGDVFNFVMEMEKSTFAEAVKALAEKTGIALPEEDDREDRSQDSIYESVHHALRFAGRFFYEQMTQTEQGRKLGLAYFEARGFTPETIKKFGLGFSPDTWDALKQSADHAHIKTEFLEKAGLVSLSSKNTYYDRFRNRAMFPIFSHVGKVIGFGGRILTNAKDQAKYVNSPETIVYSKSQVLYGLFHSKQDIRGEGEAILVEGYTDVISLHQAGIRNVVASSGTALTRQQVQALGRYAKKVLMIYDSDSAGANATLRGMNLVFEQGLSAQIVELPDGADPDSFVKQFGGEAFRRYIREHRQPFITFKLAFAKKTGQWNSPEGKTTTIREIMDTIAAMPDAIMQDMYIQEAVMTLGVTEAHLRKQLEKNHYQRRNQQQKAEEIETRMTERAPHEENVATTAPKTSPKQRKQAKEALAAEKMLIRLMLEHGLHMIEFILTHTSIEEYSEGDAQTMVQAFIEMYQNDNVQQNAFLRGDYGDSVRDFAAELLVERHSISARWIDKTKGELPTLNEAPYEVAADCMTRLKSLRLEKAIEEIRNAIFQAQQHEQDAAEWVTQLLQLQALKKSIEKREFLQPTA